MSLPALAGTHVPTGHPTSTLPQCFPTKSGIAAQLDNLEAAEVQQHWSLGASLKFHLFSQKWAQNSLLATQSTSTCQVSCISQYLGPRVMFDLLKACTEIEPGIAVGHTKGGPAMGTTC
eukprot:1162053-Pelagomonas_calceolata.AAC.12